MTLILIVAFIIFLVFIIKIGSNENERTELAVEKRGFKLTDLIPIGNYSGGHPRIDKNIENLVFRKNENELYFYIQKYRHELPSYIMSIPIISITDIQVEDATTMEKRITLGRVLLVGVFALAWKKKKKNELAFVVIEWKEGKFNNSTTFSFEGTDAMSKANIARNALIKHCN